MLSVLRDEKQDDASSRLQMRLTFDTSKGGLTSGNYVD